MDVTSTGAQNDITSPRLSPRDQEYSSSTPPQPPSPSHAPPPTYDTPAGMTKVYQNHTSNTSVSTINKQPHFVPTVGVWSIDNFAIRTFVARLRQGIIVLKHPRGR